MSVERNDRYYEANNGQLIVNVMNAKGDVTFARPVRTPIQALAEFKVACDIWFGCMDPATRAAAVFHAVCAEKDVPFAPNCEPR